LTYLITDSFTFVYTHAPLAVKPNKQLGYDTRLPPLLTEDEYFKKKILPKTVSQERKTSNQ